MHASRDDARLEAALYRNLVQLKGTEADFDAALDMIGDAHYVLLGEATHGTHEFYWTRALLTMRLIREKGFQAVAVEADWPDAYRVNRYVRWSGNDNRAEEALGDFKRFPSWLWRNADAVAFIDHLREFNASLPEERRAGFFGLDLYSLYSSIEAVIQYLEKVDPGAAQNARRRYACFEQFGHEEQAYGIAAAMDISKSCQDEAVAQLMDLRQRGMDYISRDGFVAREELFYARQNARLARNAEEYYRTMFGGRISSWNLRDRHMAETLEALAAHLSEIRSTPAKIVVWEHNSHVGDARATEMSSRGELNVGQLVREKHADDAVLIGFTTYAGTVSAASDWGEAVARERVRPGAVGSYEDLFHLVGLPAFFLPMRPLSIDLDPLRESRLERAIGVIYAPATERISHYFEADLPSQFDGVFHFDATRALEPLEQTPEWQAGEIPETYRTGL